VRAKQYLHVEHSTSTHGLIQYTTAITTTKNKSTSTEILPFTTNKLTSKHMISDLGLKLSWWDKHTAGQN
jgi:hypothetical protein